MMRKISTLAVALLMLCGVTTAQAACTVRGKVIQTYFGPAGYWFYVAPTIPEAVSIYYFNVVPVDLRGTEHAELAAISAVDRLVLVTGSAFVCPSTVFAYGGEVVQVFFLGQE